MKQQKKNKRIEIGDIVSVNFNNVQYSLCREAQVEHIPLKAGDSWVFYDLANSFVYYISEPCSVKLLRKGEES